MGFNLPWVFHTLRPPKPQVTSSLAAHQPVALCNRSCSQLFTSCSTKKVNLWPTSFSGFDLRPMSTNHNLHLHILLRKMATSHLFDSPSLTHHCPKIHLIFIWNNYTWTHIRAPEVLRLCQNTFWNCIILKLGELHLLFSFNV